MNILDIAIAKKLAGGGGGSGTDNYNELSNLPKINDTTLSGNKSSSALGLQSEINSESKLASDLVDDTNQDNKFVTSTEKNTWNAKQNAIDADHKINADYVDDSTSTNKFVTASDKETWNAKQNAIDNSHKLSSDLVDDTNHTNKFVTSTEKQTWNAKQNAIDADHKLSSSLVSFSTAEAAALASGINSSKVGQISTNQTNILSVLNRTGKNVANIQAPALTRGCTFTTGNNGAVTITNTENWSQFIVENVRVKPNTQYKLIFYTDAISNLPAFDVYPRDHDTDGSSLGANFRVSNTGTIVKDFTSISDVLSLNIYPNNQATTVSGTATFRVMVCEKTLYDLSNEYTWGIPNYDLTYLEAEDRAALAEEIDAGAKNKIDVASVTLTGAGYIFNNYDPPSTLPAGTYVLSCMSSQSTAGNLQLQVYNTSLNLIADETISSKYGTNVIKFTITETAKRMHLYSNVAGTFWNLMVCTKAAFGVSNKFVPYRPNYDLVCDKVTNFGITKIIPSFTPSAANTYECVTATKITLPANKVLRINVACIFQNSYATGIKLVRGTTMENAKTLAISESTADYNALPISTVCSFSSDQDIYVFLKCNSTGTTKLVIAYDII